MDRSCTGNSNNAPSIPARGSPVFSHVRVYYSACLLTIVVLAALTLAVLTLIVSVGPVFTALATLVVYSTPVLVGG